MNLLSESTKELLYDIFIREYPYQKPIIKLKWKGLKRIVPKKRIKKACIESIHLEMHRCSEARLQELLKELAQLEK